MKKPSLNFKYSYLLLFLVSSVDTSSAQQQSGAKLTAINTNGAALKNVWSIMGNVAGITEIESPQLAINYIKYPSDVEWSEQTFVCAVLIKKNYLGLSLQRFGMNEYNIIKAGLGMAKKFGNELAIGLKANYHQLQINNYGKSAALSIDVGAVYSPNETLTLGISINNPSLQKFDNKSIVIQIPTEIHVGATYQISDKVLMATTVRRNLDGLTDINFGFDYRLLKELNFSGRLTTKPFKEYFGIGFNYEHMALGLAFEHDSNLGLIPQIGMAYAF